MVDAAAGAAVSISTATDGAAATVVTAMLLDGRYTFLNSCASRDRIFWKHNSLWSMVSSTQSSQQIEPSLRPCQYVVTTLGQESHCTRVRDGRGSRDNIAATGLAASASAAGAGAVPATRKFRALFADMMRLSPSLWSLELAMRGRYPLT
jgi:hypothetical protein